jgi:hypothetical protein
VPAHPWCRQPRGLRLPLLVAKLPLRDGTPGSSCFRLRSRAGVRRAFGGRASGSLQEPHREAGASRRDRKTLSSPCSCAGTGSWTLPRPGIGRRRASKIASPRGSDGDEKRRDRAVSASWLPSRPLPGGRRVVKMVEMGRGRHSRVTVPDTHKGTPFLAFSANGGRKRANAWSHTPMRQRVPAPEGRGWHTLLAFSEGA